MLNLDFNNVLESVDDFYGETDSWNRLFNTARYGVSELFSEFYKRAENREDFKEIDWIDKERIFYEALDDFVEDWMKLLSPNGSWKWQ